MARNSRFQQAPGASPDRLWLSLGNRLRFRREQLSIGLQTAAAHVGVTAQSYADYETGARLIPASQLAELAKLFAVPVFYFFDELEIGEEREEARHPRPDAVYTVATQADRITALLADFKALDFERQQHLLSVARALASDKRGKATSA